MLLEVGNHVVDIGQTLRGGIDTLTQEVQFLLSQGVTVRLDAGLRKVHSLQQLVPLVQQAALGAVLQQGGGVRSGILLVHRNSFNYVIELQYKNTTGIKRTQYTAQMQKSVFKSHEFVQGE